MKRYFLALLAFYIAIRSLSFFLIGFPHAQEAIAAILIGVFLVACLKNISTGWKLLVVELLLDGAGHFFELRGLLLRTWFLGIFAAAWFWHTCKKRSFVRPQKNTIIALAAFGAVLLWAIVNGFLRHNSPHMILQDAILYLFILVLFPALEMDVQWQPLYDAATKVFIFGSALFSLLTFALYSTGLSILQDPYYHWFRDVAAGKITDLGSHFFRIVTADQILFVPIILILFSLLLKNSRDKKLWTLLLASLVVVILNFTRIYFVALGVGALILLWPAPFKQWFKVSSLTLAASALIFFSAHIVASRGQSFGLELLGVRVRGISPQTDVSAAIRVALLPDIKQHIKSRPLFGSGLGTEITYIDPVTHETKTRTQFDWGYFEMITELGAVGATIYIALLAIIIYNFAHTNPHATGIVAGAIALFVINITTPALFQGFGVLYFAFLTAYNYKLDSKIIN